MLNLLQRLVTYIDKALERLTNVDNWKSTEELIDEMEDYLEKLING